VLELEVRGEEELGELEVEGGELVDGEGGVGAEEAGEPEKVEAAGDGRVPLDACGRGGRRGRWRNGGARGIGGEGGNVGGRRGRRGGRWVGSGWVRSSRETFVVGRESGGRRVTGPPHDALEAGGEHQVLEQMRGKREEREREMQGQVSGVHPRTLCMRDLIGETAYHGRGRGRVTIRNSLLPLSAAV
jgi:hypothetical protein